MVLACHRLYMLHTAGPRSHLPALADNQVAAAILFNRLATFGQGLVLAASQLLVSLSSWIFRFHFFHLHACSHA